MNYLSSQKLKVSYLQIPKCGVTSIRECMNLNLSTPNPIYNTFTVIRNPKDRILSAYHQALRRGTFNGSFLECLQKIDYSGTFLDNHLEPICNYYKKVDKLFHFGNHFEEICNHYGFDIDFKIMNKTENYTDDYTYDSLSLFKKIYKDDIEFYNSLFE